MLSFIFTLLCNCVVLHIICFKYQEDVITEYLMLFIFWKMRLIIILV